MSATTPASIPTSGTWNIESVHSTANISVAHNVVSTFRAQFLGLTGTQPLHVFRMGVISVLTSPGLLVLRLLLVRRRRPARQVRRLALYS